jgi:hypothetical protein
MSLLYDLAALVTEHERQLITVAGAFLANTNALRAVWPYFITLYATNTTALATL